MSPTFPIGVAHISNLKSPNHPIGTPTKEGNLVLHCKLIALLMHEDQQKHIFFFYTSLLEVSFSLLLFFFS
jgi:hypothetical protein